LNIYFFKKELKKMDNIYLTYYLNKLKKTEQRNLKSHWTSNEVKRRKYKNISLIK
jgi:hypothetical protein